MELAKAVYFDKCSLHADLRIWALPFHIWGNEHYCFFGVFCFYLMYYRKAYRKLTREEKAQL